MATKADVQSYGPTSGEATGWLGLLACAIVFGVVAFDQQASVHTFRWLAGTALVALVLWTQMLRPRIIVRLPATLELRNAYSSWLVPLASVEGVSVRAVTRVEAAGRTYVCVAVGRRLRNMRREVRQGRMGSFGTAEATNRIDASTPEAQADLMTGQVLAAARTARDSGQPAGSATRRWAVPELVAGGVLVAALVVSFLR